jgi:plastocyanin
LDSPLLNQDQQFGFTFNQPGVFPYWCRVHPFMIGVITVEK